MGGGYQRSNSIAHHRLPKFLQPLVSYLSLILLTATLMALTMTTTAPPLTNLNLSSPPPPPLPTTTFLRTTPPSHRLSITTVNTKNNMAVVVRSSKGGPSSGTKEQKWVHEGLIVESLPNGMFRVKLDNEDVILGYISGRIRKSFVRVLPGDRVKVEVSRYDSSKGRITYRLRTSKDPTS